MLRALVQEEVWSQAQDNVFLRLEPNKGDPRFSTEQFFPRLKPNKGAPRFSTEQFFPALGADYGSCALYHRTHFFPALMRVSAHQTSTRPVHSFKLNITLKSNNTDQQQTNCYLSDRQQFAQHFLSDVSWPLFHRSPSYLNSTTNGNPLL